MKIVLVGTLSSYIFLFRIPLIEELVSRGHQVFVFSSDYDEDSEEKIRSHGAIPIRYRISRSGLNPLSDLALLFSLYRKIKKIAPDATLCSFVKPVIYGNLAAWLAKVPKRLAMLEGLGFAFTVQPDGVAFKTRLIKTIQIILYRFSLPLSSQLLFLNNDDKNEIISKLGSKKINHTVLGGIGLDLDVYRYTRPDFRKLSFIFVGRLIKEKGIYEFIEAAKIFKSLNKLNKEVEFIILGSPDFASPNSLSLQQLDHYVQSGLIIYPGQVCNVKDWISRSSVFVLPSYREGLPRSTQEAMAIGRPIITTDAPGCRETVINGLNGFLVTPFDSEDLAQKMLWFTYNPEQIELMGIESRKMAEQRFDVRSVNKKLINLIEN